MGRAKTTAEAALVTFEASPISTGLQVATLVGIQAATHDVARAVSAFAGLTAALELASVAATADLLSTDFVGTCVRKTHKVVRNIGLSRLNDYRPNAVMDLGTTLLLGTPAALLVKHRQDPERTAAENRRYGCKLALAATAIWSVAGGLAVAASSRPDLKQLGLAVLGLGAVISASRWLKCRWSRGAMEMADQPGPFSIDDSGALE
jgi:hypothetical protein